MRADGRLEEDVFFKIMMITMMFPISRGGGDSKNYTDCFRCGRAILPARPGTLIRQSSFTQRP